MANEDWYRNKDWNEQIAEAFFNKLSRARSQRDQYLVIQALTLSARVPSATLELVGFYFATKKDDYEDVRALVARADALLSMEKLPEAIQSYKDVLEREVEFPSHKTRTYLELPYLIASRGIASEYEYAVAVLEQGLDDFTFPVDVFLWHAANALIASEQGRMTDSSTHAKKAIDVAQVKKSGFRYHQNIGLVGKEHQGVMKKLLKLAG